MPTKSFQEARGEVQRILQEAQAYKERVIAEAQGEASRFLNVLEEYRKAPELMRAAALSGNDGARPRLDRQGHHRQ